MLQIHICYYCYLVRLYKHTKKFNLIPKEINLCRKIGGESSHYRYISFDYVSVHIIVQECTAYFMLKKIFLRNFVLACASRDKVSRRMHMFSIVNFTEQTPRSHLHTSLARCNLYGFFFPSMHTNWIRP